MTNENRYDVNGVRWKYGEPRRAHAADYHKLLGPCPQCGGPTFDYGGGWRCCDDYCWYSATNPSPNFGPEPAWWRNGTRVFRDGDAWCAVRSNFINLQESAAGFGSTPREAVSYLEDKLKTEPTHD